MLRHTSIHTYNIPEETNPLSGYVLCVWSEHGRTRLLNTPGGAQRECRQPLFSTLQHRRTQTHLPFPCSFCLRIVPVGVPVMDTVSDLWTFTAALHRSAPLCLALPRSASLAPACPPARLPFGQTSGAAAPCFPGAAAAQQATREQQTDEGGKHAYACRPLNYGKCSLQKIQTITRRTTHPGAGRRLRRPGEQTYLE